MNNLISRLYIIGFALGLYLFLKLIILTDEPVIKEVFLVVYVCVVVAIALEKTREK